MDLVSVEIDVSPHQGEQLSLAHSGADDDQHCVAELSVGVAGRSEELLYFLASRGERFGSGGPRTKQPRGTHDDQFRIGPERSPQAVRPAAGTSGHWTLSVERPRRQGGSSESGSSARLASKLEVVVDFEPSEQMSVMLAMVDDFMRREVFPLEGEFLHGEHDVLEGAMLEVQHKVRQMGLWAPNAPVDCGGLGLSMVDHGLFSEALGRSPLGHRAFGAQAPDAGNVEILHRHGTSEQRQRWLRPLVDGEISSCFSMTEPETPGSNPTMLATRAVADGDDYVLNGQKWFTTSADGAAFAIVMAVTDPAAPPHRRATMFIVPTDTPGFVLVRNISVMGHVGVGHDSHGEVSYQSCRVPAANVLGGVGDGFRIAQERLGPGRIHHCMRWLGIASRAFELLCAGPTSG